METFLRIAAPLILVGLWTYLSSYVYKTYKKILLWIQTYTLRKGYPPHIIVLKCTIKKTKQILSYFGNKPNVLRIHRQPKGLVGVIAVDIKKIKDVEFGDNSTDLNEIYFADKNGDYDSRNTHLSSEIIKSQCKIINNHYIQIGKTIDREFKNNPLFYYEEIDKNGNILKKSLDKIFSEIYSFQNITSYINKVNQEMDQNNAIHFIGDKLGIKDFTYNKGELQFGIYKTDHFTWQVFKAIFKDNQPFFREIMLRVNVADIKEQKLLIKCLAFLFSSFGIDIIIESKDCQNKRNLIITARSARIETNRESSLHVSVNETFSRTDNEGSFETKFSLYSCVKRGIQEEIGIPEEDISSEMIKFHDLAIVTDEGEIGLSCHVNLSQIMPVEQILMYPGQDKFLENDELLVLPYFRVNHIALVKSMDSPLFMHQFYAQTHNDQFNMPWMSFTPLLISRVMIRNIQYNFFGKLLWLIFYWMIIFFIIRYIFHSVTISIFEQVLTAIIQLITFCIYSLYYDKYQHKYKYKFIQPTVSQWHGNAKVVQATGGVSSKPISKGVTLGISEDVFDGTPIKLSDLELKYPPYCAVRIKKDENNYAEKPISFFQLIKKTADVSPSHLRFFLLKAVGGQFETTIGIRFNFIKDTSLNILEINNISFGRELDVFIDKCQPSEHSMCIFKYFKMTDEHIHNLDFNMKIQLPDKFISQYDLLDLFHYKDDYYWSCISTQPEAADSNQVIFALSDSECKVPEINDIYQEVIHLIAEKKENKGFIEVSITGPNELIEYWLNQFISHKKNKQRISQLEKYMLQFYLIRWRILLAECEYTKKIKYKIYDMN